MANPFDKFLHGSGLRAALNYLDQGVRAGLDLFNALRGEFRQWSRSELGDVATYARQVYQASQAANRLQPGQTLNPALIPSNPSLNVNPQYGERYRTIIEVEFQPTEDSPPVIRSFGVNWTGPPSGRDLSEAVAEYVADQVAQWGQTPKSRAMKGDDKLDPAEALKDWRVIRVEQR